MGSDCISSWSLLIFLLGMHSPILRSHLLKMQRIVLLSSLLWWELGINSLITGPGEWLSFRRFTSKLSWSWDGLDKGQNLPLPLVHMYRTHNLYLLLYHRIQTIPRLSNQLFKHFLVEEECSFLSSYVCALLWDFMMSLSEEWLIFWSFQFNFQIPLRFT